MENAEHSGTPPPQPMNGCWQTGVQFMNLKGFSLGCFDCVLSVLDPSEGAWLGGYTATLSLCMKNNECVCYGMLNLPSSASTT